MSKKFLVFYRGGTEIFLGLKSHCAKSYLLWVFFAKASWDGRFGHGEHEHRLFSEFLKVHRLRPYHWNSMKTAMAELVSSTLVLKDPGKRGQYQINPRHLWAGTREERAKALKELGLTQVSDEDLVVD